SSLVLDLLANDSDIDGDSLTLSVAVSNLPARGDLVNNGNGTFTYKPYSNFHGTDSFTYTLSDGKGGTADGVALIVVTPVADTPQVGNITTSAGGQSDPIVITPHASDGDEVTHFRISGITGGTLHLADGVTQINNGDFITLLEGRAGVKFTPAAGTSSIGRFQVEASINRTSFSTGKATATIMVLPHVEPPPVDIGEVKDPVVEEPAPVVEPAVEPVTPMAAVDGNEEPSPLFAGEPDAPPLHLVIRVPEMPQLEDDAVETGSGESSFNQVVNALLDPFVRKELQAAVEHLDLANLSREAYDLIRNSLDDLKEDINRDVMFDRAVIGSAVASSVGLSAGYVLWMLKGGSLLASVLSSMPAWQLADPLSILVGKKDDDKDEEGLEKIIEDGSIEDDENEQDKDEDEDGDSV
uniref:cadherin-like domain-containing protein n=1 Tax=Trichloromonas sp. TaxID=3069249 RepID=UPI003D813744